jgi:uncharacterized cupin superfamily protein
MGQFTDTSPNEETQLTVAGPYLAQAATMTELEDWGPLEEATGTEMQTSGYTLWEDGAASSGVWVCSPGPSFWKLDTNEFVHIIGGSMTVTPEGGESVTLKAGDTMVFPRGWEGTWEIHETLRKLYVIF